MKVSASYRFKRAECGLFNTCIYKYTAEVNLVGEGSTYHEDRKHDPTESCYVGGKFNNIGYAGLFQIIFHAMLKTVVQDQDYWGFSREPLLAPKPLIQCTIRNNPQFLIKSSPLTKTIVSRDVDW